MISISRQLDDKIEYKGISYRINLAFDRVLTCYQVQADEWLEPEDKIDIMSKLLVKDKIRLRRLKTEDKAKLINHIFERMVNINSRKGKPGPKTFDWEADGDLVYSAYMQAYGIDLYDVMGQLDWRQFCAMFVGLPEQTKLREVMSIRSREVPPPTKDNHKERQAILDAKAYWALPQDNNYQEQLQVMFDTLSKMAR